METILSLALIMGTWAGVLLLLWHVVHLRNTLGQIQEDVHQMRRLLIGFSRQLDPAQAAAMLKNPSIRDGSKN